MTCLSHHLSLPNNSIFRYIFSSYRKTPLISVWTSCTTHILHPCHTCTLQWSDTIGIPLPSLLARLPSPIQVKVLQGYWYLINQNNINVSIFPWVLTYVCYNHWLLFEELKTNSSVWCMFIWRKYLMNEWKISLYNRIRKLDYQDIWGPAWDKLYKIINEKEIMHL